ncbi:Crp/Fnr family transcriptional regulator [bacterium]|nr:Crp/Fnr family transcriptional regulator [bacterium]
MATQQSIPLEDATLFAEIEHTRPQDASRLRSTFSEEAAMRASMELLKAHSSKASAGTLARLSDEEAQRLTGTLMFRGISAAETKAMMGCLQATRREYDAGEYVMHEGDRAYRMGLVLTGSVTVERTDAWGSRSIVSTASSGDTFAAVYSCTAMESLPIDVVAQSKTSILLFDVDRILRVCSHACLFHARIIRNLLGAIAMNNMRLENKIESITPRTIRKRILSYLSLEARRADSRHFDIQFNRQQLADYLCVDRSALCHELSKMQSDGLIDFDRNSFTLLAPQEA